jgi:hypothetical protein
MAMNKMMGGNPKEMMAGSSAPEFPRLHKYSTLFDQGSEFGGYFIISLL